MTGAIERPSPALPESVIPLPADKIEILARIYAEICMKKKLRGDDPFCTARELSDYDCREDAIRAAWPQIQGRGEEWLENLAAAGAVK